jgi:hypothetical protein
MSNISPSTRMSIDAMVQAAPHNANRDTLNCSLETERRATAADVGRGLQRTSANTNRNITSPSQRTTNATQQQQRLAKHTRNREKKGKKEGKDDSNKFLQLFGFSPFSMIFAIFLACVTHSTCSPSFAVLLLALVAPPTCHIKKQVVVHLVSVVVV